MRNRSAFRRTLVTPAALVFCFNFAAAATNPYWARISVFAQAAQLNKTGADGYSSSELVTTFTLRSYAEDRGGFEYALDTRLAGYPSSEEGRQRVSIYDAHLGWWTSGRTFGIRAGQVWLDELGALGSLGGAAAEIRPWKQMPLGLGTLRIGAFAGLEPKILEAGYNSDVKKFGGYLAIDGAGARRHVLGYINVRNSGLTERSVIVFNNFIPVNRSFFLYQAAEYDLKGPAGKGSGKLTYFFANARFSPLPVFELQGLYHRGRSVDTRTIIDNLLSGRPVDEASLEGFLFESLGGRVTVRPWRGFQVFGGYAQDRTSREGETRDRYNLGLFTSDLFRSGFDLRISGSWFKERNGSSYDSWYVSLGRTIGRSVYLEGFYHSSVAVFRLANGDINIERRPHTDLFGLSSNVYLARRLSLLLTFEHTADDSSYENRLLSGLSYRF